MTIRPPLLALLLLAASAGNAAAGDCSAAETQTEMNLCAGAAFDAADAELNALYKQISARLKSDAATTRLLVATQRAWIAFRDAECDFAASSVAGGSIAPMIRAECLTSLTEARNATFRTYLSCEEGDLSCPVRPAP